MEDLDVEWWWLEVDHEKAHKEYRNQEERGEIAKRKYKRKNV